MRKRVRALVAILLCVSGHVDASSTSDVLPIGGGTYMLTGRNATVFGSADGIAAKLLARAHAYCKTNGGSEALLVEKDGESAAVGVRTASATIYFKCQTANVANAAPVSRRHFVVLESGMVAFQITFPTGAECQELVESSANASMHGVCSDRSHASALPLLSIIADSRDDDDVVLLRARDLANCKRITSEFAGAGAVTLLDCP